MKVFLTGACGYKGSVLVPKLLKAGHRVVAFDSMWFGNVLEPHPDLTVVKGDVRNIDDVDLTGIDAVIHLSSVANDPLRRSRSKTDLGNQLPCHHAARRSRQTPRRRAIVYADRRAASPWHQGRGTGHRRYRTAADVETTTKTRMCSERIVLSYKDDMIVQIVRPATVCGYSPRQRLDVSVNMLTMQALTNGRMTVFGGDQIRPNIHIDDITDLYLFLLDHPEHTGIYNAGSENISILDIANLVASHVKAEIVVT